MTSESFQATRSGALVALILGIAGLARAGPPAASGDGFTAPLPTERAVKRYVSEATRALAAHNLLLARSAAWKAWTSWATLHRKSGVPPGGSEPPFYIIAYPEGEALRFYDWTGGSLTLVEIGSGKVRRAWQAVVIQRAAGHPEPPGGRPLPFPFDRLCGNNNFYLGREYGRRPVWRKSMVFFRIDPTVAQAVYGIIDPSGTESAVNRLGNQALTRYLEQHGWAAVIPGEPIAPKPY
jgi:hypothetical protein